MNRYLYHFFPRKFESIDKTLFIVHSILQNGLFLTEETLNVDWKDLYAVNGNQRDLSTIQLRFCLTAINERNELRNHANKFGFVGLEFEEDFILKLGGFPVFYIPTPRYEDAGIEEYTGVSLLYRLADVQEILEHILDHSLIKTKDIDLDNVLGAIKFLSNICYPTQRKIKSPATEQMSYHNQREWRIIYNLTPELVKTGYCYGNYTIEAFENKPLRNFITRILIFEMQNISVNTSNSIVAEVQKLIDAFGLNCKLELVPLNERKSHTEI